MNGLNGGGMNRKSVQAGPLLGHFSRSDVRYSGQEALAVSRVALTENCALPVDDASALATSLREPLAIVRRDGFWST